MIKIKLILEFGGLMYLVGSKFRYIAGAVVAALVIATGGAGSAEAQQSQSQPSQSQPSGNATVSAFLANPQQLLQQNPNGGPALSDAVQGLTLADPSTFKVIIGLTATANDQQKAAIGAGLAQATKIKVLTDQALATDWQQQIAAITDQSFQIAATNAFGDVQLGSVGGGSLGAAGSGLGGPGSGPGGLGGGTPPENIQSTPVTTQSFTLTSSISGAGTVTNSVSP
jgi:hypothetical protein